MFQRRYLVFGLAIWLLSSTAWAEIHEIDARAVTDRDFARSSLYSWTTAGQVAALHQTLILLVAEAGIGQTSPFNLALIDIVEKQREGQALAALLLEHPQLKKRRYAWPSPFATALPRGKHSYGNALLHIELRPEAWIAHFEPSRKEAPFWVVDMQGNEVSMDQVLATPLRLGAIYHLAHGHRAPRPFREYILCNEGMIAAWSVGTPEIQQQVEKEIALLESLLSWKWRGEVKALDVWQNKVPVANALTRWYAAVAFDIDRYRPGPRHLRKIIAALRDYDPAGGALYHRLGD